MKTVGIALCVSFLLGCPGDVRSKPPFVLEVHVLTDTGDAVAGATLSRDGMNVGATDASGARLVSIAGTEGQRVRFSVRCPSTYRPNHAAQETALRRVTGFQQAGVSPHVVALTCLPMLRRGVLVVRALGATRMPVLVDGKLVAHTNQRGIAHVSLSLVPESSVRVALDTTAFPKLGPANPSQRFVVEDRDAILAFDQTLVEVKPPQRRAKRSRPRDVPYRLN